MLKQLSAIVLIGLGSLLVAQQPPAAGRGGRPAAALPGFEIHSDRTVTFRLRAPEATVVSVAGDFTQTPLKMTKGSDGLWSATSSPLRPAIYNYSFTVDGVRALDAGNPMRDSGDRSSGNSLFEVKGDKPAPWDLQPVPHGEVHIDYYESSKYKTTRMMYVYTPPGYESSNVRYPALYLMHGAGGLESSWYEGGKANLILDNLIAGNRAKPMIVVMPYGRPGQEPSLSQNFAPANGFQEPQVVFPNDVVEDVIPFAEKKYRISARPDDRAIAGLSMGGNQTLQVGLTHLDLFRYIGAFSPVVMNNSVEQDYKVALDDPASTNKKLKLFNIYIGKTDTLFASNQSFHELLEKKGIKHTFTVTDEWHVWRNWRDYLVDFAPKLFR